MIKIISILLFFLGMLFTAQKGYAIKDTTSHYYHLSELKNKQRDTLFISDFYNYAGAPRNGSSRPHLKEATQVLSLYVSPDWNSNSWNDQKYTATLNGYLLSGIPGNMDTLRFSLSVEYDIKNPTSYKAKDILFRHITETGAYTILVIDPVLSKITNSLGQEVVVPVNTNNMVFKIGNQIQYEKAYPSNEATLSIATALNYAIDPLSNNIKFWWNKKSIAEYYDLEWCYIDDYRYNAGMQRKPASQIFSLENREYINALKKQSSRVSTPDTSYELPAVFESGYLLVRMRAVGTQGLNYDQPVYGKWKEITVEIAANNIPAFTTDKMNWQYQAMFSDDGKRKDVVSFLDGTLRERQNLVSLNTEKNILVSEDIYDYQGRPAIQMIPAPVLNNNSPALQFYGSFNVNMAGQSYSRDDFDTTSQTCSGLTPARLNSISGAGKYYSSSNVSGGIDAFIPDAEGYPFIQTNYMPDPTGRVRSIGMAGLTNQIGQGHQKSFEYSNPSQEELDKLFGNNIGFAGHYDKESMQDENGQLLVSYKDEKGNFVASALAGITPDMLDDLERNSQAISIDLLEESNIADSVANTITAIKNIQLGKTSNLHIEYNIVGEHFKAYVPGITDSLCMDCIYDLELKLVNSCGTEVFKENQTIGNIASALFECEANGYFKDTTITLQPGTYTLTKIITINKAAQEKYEEEYLKLYTVDSVRRPLIDHIPPETVSVDCTADECNPCTYDQKTISQNDGNSYIIRTKNISTKPCIDYCPGKPVSPCQGAYQAMLQDVSPGGQYGEYEYTNSDDETSIVPYLYKFSVYNLYNKLRPTNLPANGITTSEEISSKTWRKPATPYVDESGAPARVAIYDDEHNFIEYKDPADLSLTNFIKYWQPSWAASLVPYHPEYCYYEWCLLNEKTVQFNDDLMAIADYNKAVAKGLSRLDDLKQNDPIKNNAQLFGQFSERLNKFFVVGTQKFNVEKGAVAVVNCITNNGDPQALINCISATEIYNDALPVELKDKEWVYLKTFYLSVRRKLMAEERKKFVQHRNGCMTNDCIGIETFANQSFDIDPAVTNHPDNTSTFEGAVFNTGDPLNTRCCTFTAPDFVFDNNTLTIGTTNTIVDLEPDLCRILKKKNKIFYEPDDIFDIIDTAKLADLVDQALYTTCGKCIEVFQLELLLNAMAETGNFAAPVTLPSAPPLVLYEELLEYFTDPNAKLYDVVPIITSQNKSLYLSFRPTGTSTEVFGLKLNALKPPEWRLIKSIKCLEVTGKHTFTVTAGFDNDRIITLTGETTYIDFTTCKPPNNCRLSTRGRDLKFLLEYVTQRPQLYFANTSIKSLPPSVGRRIIPFTNNSKNWWFWRLNTVTAAGNTVTYNAEVLHLALSQLLLNHLRSRNNIFRLDNFPYFPFSSEYIYQKFIAGDLSRKDELTILKKIIKYIENPGTNKKYKVFLDKCALQMTNPDKRNEIEIFKNFEDFTLEPPGKPKTDSCKLHQAIFTGSTAGKPKKGILFVKFNCFDIIDCCLKKGHNGLCCLPEDPFPIHAYPEENACENDAQDYDGLTRERFADDYIQNKLDSIRKAYYRKCFRAFERFTASYADDMYHYTLYYYDRAGNLVQTVPPAGVDILTEDRIQLAGSSRIFGTAPVYNNHRLATTYEYNSLNQLIKTNTPDGGITLHCYDESGRIILTQNAYHKDRGRAIYTIYDQLGRITETGECNAILKTRTDGTIYFPDELPYYNYLNTVRNDLSRTEITQTIYDTAINATTAAYFEEGQQHLRNRISATIFRKLLSGPYDQATHYSYDMYGNVKELAQEYSELARRFPFITTGNQHIKKIQYEYDIISGKVNRVLYQKNQPDQFIHYYVYDADKRLKEVRTSTSLYEDTATIDIDVTYQYYKHGKLARIELGKDKVQGIDYAYTINDWLKALNGDNLSPATEMGKDGYNSPRVAKDVFGLSIGYFNNDYRPVGGTAIGGFAANMQSPALVNTSLYNGNIRHLVTANTAFGNDSIQATQYRYDQLSRLKDMQVYERNSSGWENGLLTEKYRNKFTYDANGNILSQVRRDGNAVLFDSLLYKYKTNNNQLTHITDDVSPGLKEYDIDNQGSGNYRYDTIGRLTKDAAERIDSISWANHHKPYFVAKNTGDTISFLYDAMGNRIAKTYRGKTTLYVKDAMGTLLATYLVENGSIKKDEQYIYGGQRIGIYRPSNTQLPDSLTQWRGQKSYELNNHLANVLAIISDRRIVDSLYTNQYVAQILSANDYYPFGMKMTGSRQYAANGSMYRYGFNGKEFDDEMDGGNYDYGFRTYNPRIAKFLSLDPLQNKYPELTPYQFASNNPIAGVDLDGREFFGAGYLVDAISGEAGEMGYTRTAGFISSYGHSLLIDPIYNVHSVIKTASKGDVSGTAMQFDITPVSGTINLYETGERAINGDEFAQGALVGSLPAIVGGMKSLKSVPSAGPKKPVIPPADVPTKTLYRGVNESHVHYKEALKGDAIPNGGSATPLEHNTMSTLNSPYTSWTTDINVAINFALRPGGKGVVLRAEIPLQCLVESPNKKVVNLKQSPGTVVSESEVLVKGEVRGAQTEIVTPQPQN